MENSRQGAPIPPSQWGKDNMKMMKYISSNFKWGRWSGVNVWSRDAESATDPSPLSAQPQMRSWCPRSVPSLRRRMNNDLNFPPNFEGLVLVCIDADFCKWILVGKLLTRSTRCTCFCTAQTSIFQKKKIRQTFSHFSAKLKWKWILWKNHFWNTKTFWVFGRTFAETLRSERCKRTKVVCNFCRSRQGLSNEKLLAKIGVDTAENDPIKIWMWFNSFYSFASLLKTT